MADTGSKVAEFPALVLTLIVGATVLVLVYISSLLKSQKQEEDVKSQETVQPVKEKPSESTNVPHKSKKKPAERWGRDSKQAFSHPWLLTTLKGHSARVLDIGFSSNGKHLASCGEDRAVLIWNTKDFAHKEHKSLRVNIEFDYATHVKWSPDSKAFIIQKAVENVVEVYKVGKKPEGGIGNITKAITFPKHHETDVVGFGIACTGKFIMTCSDKTDLVLWDLRGQKLSQVDTYLMNTLCAQVSPCGRYVAASGFTPDVKVWDVNFTRAGDFDRVSRAFELKGHTSGIYNFCFNADSSRMATVSKDGTWKAFDTKIEYEKGEDPHLLKTEKYNHTGYPPQVALSPDGLVVAVAAKNTLSLYSVLTGKCEQTIDNIHTEPVSRVLFDSLGKYVLTTGDKHIHVFHNVAGYRAIVECLQEKLRHGFTTSAMKERMDQQIKEAKAFLKEIGDITS